MSQLHEEILHIARCLADANKRLRAIEEAPKEKFATPVDIARLEGRLVMFTREVAMLAQKIESDETTRHAFAARAVQLREEFEVKMAEIQDSVNKKEFEAAKGIVPRGEWEQGMVLNRLDIVTVNGSSFIALRDGIKEKPSSRNKADFQILARRGGTGGGVNEAATAAQVDLAIQQVALATAQANAAAASAASASASAASASASASSASSSASSASSSLTSVQSIAGRVGAYSSITLNGGSTVLAVANGATKTKVTAFTAVGAEFGAVGDIPNSKITIQPGKYFVSIAASATSATNTDGTFSAFVGGVESNVRFVTRLTGNVASGAACGTIEVVGSAADLDLRVGHSGGVSINFTLRELDLAVIATGICTNPETKTGSFTATVARTFVLTSTGTVTDPTTRQDGSALVAGDFYQVEIGASGATATIGGVALSSVRGASYLRQYDGTTWSTYDLNAQLGEQQRILKTPRFSQKVSQIYAGNSATASLMITGDSYSYFCFPVENLVSLYKSLGFKGVWSGPGVNFALADYTLYGTAATTNETNFSPNATSFLLDASGEGVGFGMPETFRALGYVANRHTYVYGIGPSQGQIKIQTGLDVNGVTTWTDVTTINCFNASVATATYQVTTTFRQKTRALWVSGTNHIVGAYLEDTTATAGFVCAMIGAGGTNLTGQVNNVPQASLNTFVQLMAPDLVCQTYADADVSTAYPVMYSRWQTALSTAEFLFISPINGQPEDSGSGDTRRDQIKDFARANNQEYFDMRVAIPTYAYANSRSWMLDAGHLNSTGTLVASENFWRSFGQVFTASAYAVAPKQATLSQAISPNSNRVFMTAMQRFMAASLSYPLDWNDTTKVGSPTFDHAIVSLPTTTTPNTEVYCYTGPNLYISPYNNSNRIDWDKPQGFGLKYYPIEYTSTGIFRWVIGAIDKNTPTSANNCIALEIRNQRIWLISANSTTLTTLDTGYDVNNTTTLYNFYLYSDGLGSVSLWVLGNNSIATTNVPKNNKIAQISGGPTTNAATSGSYGVLIYNTNGANSASNRAYVGRYFHLSAY